MNRSLQKIDFKCSVNSDNNRKSTARTAQHNNSSRRWTLTGLIGSVFVLTITAISANTVWQDNVDKTELTGNNTAEKKFSPGIIDRSSDARDSVKLVTSTNQIKGHNNAPVIKQHVIRQQVQPANKQVARVSNINSVQRIENKVDNNWLSIVVEKGDNLTTIFKRIGLSPLTAMQLSEAQDADKLTRIRPGQTIHVQKGPRNELLKLRYAINTFETLNITKDNKGQFNSELIKRIPNTEIAATSGRINSSLSAAAAQAGLPDKTLVDFASIFGWQVDFAKDIQQGDTFNVIYEKLYLDGEHIGNGDIIAAELNTGGSKIRAIRHIDSDGHTNYYTPEGEALKGSFLRTPMRFARVTSGFTKRRFHPVLKRWRSHKGVDYGAPTGTPILVTGEGTVSFAGRKGGYGNVVIIRHGRGYETLYAHMSRFGKGIRPGKRVSQGQVIGYVGSTGLATGPHLHYEFRINGRHVNPLTVKLPKAESIASKYKAEFLTQSSLWQRQLDRLQPGSDSGTRIVRADGIQDSAL